MSGLAITGYPSTYRAPFTAAEILMAQGPGTSGIGEREALYVGPMTSSGNATAGVVYPVRTEADVVELAGPGSPVHRGIATHLKLNKTGKVNVLLYAASSGAGATAATNALTITVSGGGNPTGSGTIRLMYCEEVIDVSFTPTSTATTVGEELEAKINAKSLLPFTADNAAGVVTNTAKIAGDSQNAIYRTRVVSVTPGLGVSAAFNSATLTGGADGAVTENAGLEAAILNIEASRYYYIGTTSPVSGDIASVATHVVNKSQPNPGLRTRMYAGSVASLSSTAAIAIARNSERVNIFWQLNSNHCPAQLAAAYLAATQLTEQVDPTASLDYYSPANWPIQPAYSQSDWPTAEDINDAIVDGVTPCVSNQFRSYIAMAVTTRSKDSTGARDDFRATEPHRISAMDHFADTLVTRAQSRYAGFKLRDDRRLADGTIDPNQEVPKNTVTPSLYQSFVANIIQEYLDNGYFQEETDWFDSLICIIDPQNNARLQTGVCGRVVDLLHQQSFLLSETTPG